MTKEYFLVKRKTEKYTFPYAFSIKVAFVHKIIEGKYIAKNISSFNSFYFKQNKKNWNCDLVTHLFSNITLKNS